LGKLSFAAVVARFLPEVGVEDVLFAGPTGSVLFAEFVNTVPDWLWCNGTMEVGFGWLDVLVGKVRDQDIAGGGIDTAAFLVGEGCRWRTVVLVVLRAPCGFVAFEPVLAG
jgi:hypothetical protein